MKLKELVGSGDKIGLFLLPFLIIGLILNLVYPPLFSVGGPPDLLKQVSVLVLFFGVTVWIWTVALILINVPQKKLITGGPYSLVKHPLYIGVALLVLPWVGFLLNTWLGVVLGLILYYGSRKYSSEEEKLLSKTFGSSWNEYLKEVKMPWL